MKIGLFVLYFQVLYYCNFAIWDRAQQFYQRAGILHALFQSVAREVGVLGRDRLEGDAEEGVDGLTAGIDRSYTCRCEHNVWLGGVVGDIAQESRFARSGFAGKENRLRGILDEFPGFAELGVIKVNHLLVLDLWLGLGTGR